MVYEPENYENVKRNFQFTAVANLLQRETEVGCFTKRDLSKYPKIFSLPKVLLKLYRLI